MLEDQCTARDAPMDEEAIAPESSSGLDVDEPVLMKDNIRLGPFQTQILECRTMPLIGESAHVMVMLLRAGESKLSGMQPLSPGLHVLRMYTRLKMGSSKVSVVVKNMSESAIFLGKGASAVPPMELSTEMEATLVAESTWEPMSVTMWQEKLLEKLNSF